MPGVKLTISHSPQPPYLTALQTSPRLPTKTGSAKLEETWNRLRTQILNLCLCRQVPWLILQKVMFTKVWKMVIICLPATSHFRETIRNPETWTSWGFTVPLQFRSGWIEEGPPSAPTALPGPFSQFTLCTQSRTPWSATPALLGASPLPMIHAALPIFLR